MFSSAVPVKLVYSIWQAFHDGVARVAMRISAMTSELSSSVHPLDEALPALCSCAEAQGRERRMMTTYDKGDGFL